MPGRSYCGELIVADIGITDGVVERLGPRCWQNGPWAWMGQFHWPEAADHKYRRGHVAIRGGSAHERGGQAGRPSGAPRSGAGLVTVLAEEAVLPLYAADQPGLLTAPLSEFNRYLGDRRVSCVLLGPGNGADG